MKRTLLATAVLLAIIAAACIAWKLDRIEASRSEVEIQRNEILRDQAKAMQEQAAAIYQQNRLLEKANRRPDPLTGGSGNRSKQINEF